MKTNIKQNKLLKKGLTLIELTVVIVVLLSLIGVLFIGAGAWQRGANRANCIVNIRNFQQSLRSYTNLYPNGVTTTTAATATPAIPAGSQTVILANMTTAGFTVTGTGLASCPLDDAAYTLPTIVPAIDNAWASCANATSDNHAPDSTQGW